MSLHFYLTVKLLNQVEFRTKLFKIARHGDPALRQRVLDSDHRHLNGEEIPQKWKQAIMKVLYDKKVKTESGDYVGVSL